MKETTYSFFISKNIMLTAKDSKEARLNVHTIRTKASVASITKKYLTTLQLTLLPMVVNKHEQTERKQANGPELVNEPTQISCPFLLPKFSISWE